MVKLTSKTKTRMKIVGATAVSIFTLATAFTGTIAWFTTHNTVEGTGMSIKVSTPEAAVDSVKLVKFDYGYMLVGGTKMYNYLAPEQGDVNSYTYDPTYDSNRGGFVREHSGGYIEADIMNRYDPVDSIIHGGSLREMNCNSVYEVVLSSDVLTDCYMNVDAILESQIPGANQICLSDCATFDVFMPSDLEDSNKLFWDKDNENYHAYYPEYSFKNETEEHLYYKISYLTDLRNSNLTADELVEMGILDAEDLEGKTDEQKAELARATVGPASSSFYKLNPKDDTNVVTGKEVTFEGTPKKTVTVYINVNYSPSQLERYMTDIYTKSLVAIEDFHFTFSFSESGN